MSQKTDCMLGTRVWQLALAKQWQAVITAKATAWNIPAAEGTAFGSLITAVDAALKKVKDKATRTHVDTAACNEAFDALTSKMRFIKNNYFNSPPRTAVELATLALSNRGKSSDVPPPQNQVTAKCASMRYQFRKAKLCWEWRNILVALAGSRCASYSMRGKDAEPQHALRCFRVSENSTAHGRAVFALYPQKKGNIRL